MGLPRSTFYDVPAAPVGDVELVEKIVVICDEFETYGYRRVRAELRHQGFVVNGKKIRRLMRENGLQPKRRRRYVITTNSDHESPIFPDLARDQKIDGPNQLWVADITYIAIETGFVYLAVILDGWSRRVVGYAISRSIDARLAIAALKSAVLDRNPPKGCTHHSDRGSQYASADYRQLLTTHGLVGSMSHRGNPYDNAKAKSFRKTDGLRNIRGRNRRSSPLPRRGLQSSEAPLCARLSKPRAVRRSPRPAEGQNRSLILSGLRGARQPSGQFRLELPDFGLRIVQLRHDEPENRPPPTLAPPIAR